MVSLGVHPEDEGNKDRELRKSRKERCGHNYSHDLQAAYTPLTTVKLREGRSDRSVARAGLVPVTWTFVRCPVGRSGQRRRCSPGRRGVIAC